MGFATLYPSYDYDSNNPKPETRNPLPRILMNSQKLKTLTIRHCDFKKQLGLPAS
jgi:hypothetical protein